MLKPTTKLGWCSVLLGTIAALPLDLAAQQPWTKRFRFGASVGFGYEANFSSSGVFLNSNSPGLPGQPGLNHTYDDGYVLIDSSGNAGGQTWNWGYQNASQYDAAANTLTFNSTGGFVQQPAASSGSDPILTGFDLAYGNTLTEFIGGDLGWELGFMFLPMEHSGSDSARITGQRTTHQFNTGGIVVPGAPYSGSAAGPGPTISDIATDVSMGGGNPGTMTGSRELNSRMYNLRLGANQRWNLGGRWSLSAGLGVAGALVSTKYEYNEVVAFDTGGTSNFIGDFEDSHFVYGGYGELLVYWRAEGTGEFYFGGQYMGMTGFTTEQSGRRADLDLSQGLFFAAGVHWAF